MEAPNPIKLLLSNQGVDYVAFRNYCFNNGIPDVYHIRSLCWKILLGYLPIQLDQREEAMKQKRNAYISMVKHLYIDRDKVEEISDHPLSSKKDSRWNAFFSDNDLLRMILCDCIRLRSELSFFQSETQFPLGDLIEKHQITSESQNRSCFNTITAVSFNGLSSRIDKSQIHRCEHQHHCRNVNRETHFEVIQRILFIYAKTHSHVGYVQGMNEIIGPLYFVFYSDTDRNTRVFAEIDAFYCFSLIMGQIQNSFIKAFDNDKTTGVGKLMSTFMKTLKKEDFELHLVLVKMQIDPKYFAFRWLTLLFAQEFELPDLISIWDVVFSDPHRFKFTHHFAVAMITLIRHSIINKEYEDIINILLNYPHNEIPVHVIIKRGVQLYKKVLETTTPIM